MAKIPFGILGPVIGSIGPVTGKTWKGKATLSSHRNEAKNDKNPTPAQLNQREKFGFVAPGSPALLKTNKDWVKDLLSYERIKSQGFFDPDAIERLKKLYVSDVFVFNPPYDIDLLIIVLTFNIILDLFEISN